MVPESSGWKLSGGTPWGTRINEVMIDVSV